MSHSKQRLPSRVGVLPFVVTARKAAWQSDGASPSVYHVAVKLETLRCPNCNAPADGFRTNQTVCRYCGVTLVADRKSSGRTESRFSLILRVGPSNVDRVAALIAERVGIDLTEAHSLLSSQPYEIEFGLNEIRARALALDVSHAGGQAEVVERIVEIPLVSVLLQDPGANKLATIVAIRQHVDLSILETRQLIERVPVLIVEAMEEPLALKLVADLSKAGARARVG
jgi:ribosomal protein L7/L12